MFTVSVNIDGLVRKMDTMSLSAKDLEQPLRKFGGYLKKRAIERYKAQDFPPLAQSTIEGRARKGLASMEGKLRRDLKKAVNRAAPRAPRGLLETILGRAGAIPDLSAINSSRGVQNRQAVLDEFKRQHRRGDAGLQSQAGGKALTIKQLASLGQRTDRALAKAVGRPILGGLPQTLKVETGMGSMTLASRTREQWTDVHNAGGTAGKGAKIPKRETIRVDEQDLDVLVEILKEHLVAPLEE